MVDRCRVGGDIVINLRDLSNLLGVDYIKVNKLAQEILEKGYTRNREMVTLRDCKDTYITYCGFHILANHIKEYKKVYNNIKEGFIV